MIEIHKKDGGVLLFNEDNVASVGKGHYGNNVGLPALFIHIAGDGAGFTFTENDIDVDEAFRLFEIALSHGKNIYRTKRPEKGKEAQDGIRG